MTPVTSRDVDDALLVTLDAMMERGDPRAPYTAGLIADPERIPRGIFEQPGGDVVSESRTGAVRVISMPPAMPQHSRYQLCTALLEQALTWLLRAGRNRAGTGPALEIRMEPRRGESFGARLRPSEYYASTAAALRALIALCPPALPTVKAFPGRPQADQLELTRREDVAVVAAFIERCEAAEDVRPWALDTLRGLAAWARDNGGYTAEMLTALHNIEAGGEAPVRPFRPGFGRRRR